MNSKYYLNVVGQSLVVTSLVVSLLGSMFFVLEPQVSRAVAGDPFTIKQTITDEISFLVQAPSVTMTGSLQGITGGTANGSTTAVVKSNNATGYTMSIAFANNTTPNAMLGDTTLSESIHDYPATGGQPTFLFSTASTSAVFGYSVGAANTSDIDQSFLHDGASCNTSTGYTLDRCWMEPQTSSFQIIDRDSAADTGATTTVYFRVHVPNSPTPAVTEDIYTATATLTALNK